MNFPLTVLSYAHFNPDYKDNIIGSKKANVFPDPFIARSNKLNFFLFESKAIYRAYYCTLVGLFFFCDLKA